MNLLYKSTRNSEKTVTASQAILKGLAEDGGLFVPVSIPKLPVSLGELKNMNYQENIFAKTMNGNPMIDKAYKMLCTA